jgi:hypothetical protein
MEVLLKKFVKVMAPSQGRPFRTCHVRAAKFVGFRPVDYGEQIPISGPGKINRHGLIINGWFMRGGKLIKQRKEWAQNFPIGTTFSGMAFQVIINTAYE